MVHYRVFRTVLARSRWQPVYLVQADRTSCTTSTQSNLRRCPRCAGHSLTVIPRTTSRQGLKNIHRCSYRIPAHSSLTLAPPPTPSRGTRTHTATRTRTPRDTGRKTWTSDRRGGWVGGPRRGCGGPDGSTAANTKMYVAWSGGWVASSAGLLPTRGGGRPPRGGGWRRREGGRRGRHGRRQIGRVDEHDGMAGGNVGRVGGEVRRAGANTGGWVAATGG